MVIAAASIKGGAPAQASLYSINIESRLVAPPTALSCIGGNETLRDA